MWAAPLLGRPRGGNCHPGHPHPHSLRFLAEITVPATPTPRALISQFLGTFAERRKSCSVLLSQFLEKTECAGEAKAECALAPGLGDR